MTPIPEALQSVSIDRAAEQLGVGRSMLHHRISDGRIPCVRIGRSIRLPKCVILALALGEDPFRVFEDAKRAALEAAISPAAKKKAARKKPVLADVFDGA